MLELLSTLINNRTFGFWQSVLGEIAAFFLIYLFFQKNGRDERGRAIIGKASIVATIYFIIITTVIAQVFQYAFPIEYFDVYVWGNSIQFIFNTVIIVEIVAILIFRKLQ